MTIFHYVKYLLLHVVGLFSVATLLAGGVYISVGLLVVLFIYTVGDALSGDDLSTPNFSYPGFLTVLLWLALPELMLIVFAALWSVSSGDLLGFGAWGLGVYTDWL